MSCDLCGKNAPTTLVRIEGVAYDACSACAAYGKKIPESRPKPKRTPRTDDRVLRPDAGAVLRRARERSGKTMEEFAKYLSVKESDLHAWETGHRTPTVKAAERLEKRLHITLLESASDTETETNYSRTVSKTGSGGGMTIADMLKKK